MICTKCKLYKEFGTKCFYFWKQKRACTQFNGNEYVSEPDKISYILEWYDKNRWGLVKW